MVETIVRRPFLAAVADQTLAAFVVDISPILSAVVTRGYDQTYGQCSLVLPHPRPFWTAVDDVFIAVYMHDTRPASVPVPFVEAPGTDPQTTRFVGRLGGVDLDLYASTVTVRCYDLLYQAAKYFPDVDHDFAGLTDEEIVRAVLAIVPSVPLFIEDPDPIGGSGVVVSEDELIWPRMESALDVILEMDALTGYRTFTDAFGVIRRAALSTEPAADGLEDHTLIEGVDLFDAHGSFDFLPPIADLVGLDGTTIELVSADVDRRTLVTPRADIFEPGQTIRVTAAHLGGTDRNYWLQAVTITIDEQGAFTQQLDLNSGEPSRAVTTAPPCGSGTAAWFVEYGTTMWVFRDDDTWDERGTFVGTPAFSGQQALSDDPFFVFSADGDGLYRSESAGCAVDFTSTPPPVIQNSGLIHSRDRSYAYGFNGHGVHMVTGDVWTEVAASTGPTRSIAQVAVGPSTLWYISQSADGTAYNAYAAALDGSGATLLGTYGTAANTAPSELWGSKTSDDLALGFDRVGHTYKLTASTIATGGMIPGLSGGTGGSWIVYANSKDGTTWLAVVANTEGSIPTPCYVYRSTDGGDSWTSVLSGTRSSFVGLLRPAYGEADGEWMAALPDTGLYRSTDDGATWTLVDPPVGAVGDLHMLAGVSP